MAVQSELLADFRFLRVRRDTNRHPRQHSPEVVPALLPEAPRLFTYGAITHALVLTAFHLYR